MTTKLLTSSTGATHFADVVYTRELNWLEEIETDYDTRYFEGAPDQAFLEALVPEGWELVEFHVSPYDDSFDDEPEIDYDRDEYEWIDLDTLSGGHDFADDEWELSSV